METLSDWTTILCAIPILITIYRVIPTYQLFISHSVRNFHRIFLIKFLTFSIFQTFRRGKVRVQFIFLLCDIVTLIAGLPIIVTLYRFPGLIRKCRRVSLEKSWKIPKFYPIFLEFFFKFFDFFEFFFGNFLEFFVDKLELGKNWSS